MLTQPTLAQLNEMRLHALARAWQAQHEDPSTDDLGFDDRLALLVEAEWTDRQNKRLSRLLRAAKLRIAGACLEDLQYAKERNPFFFSVSNSPVEVGLSTSRFRRHYQTRERPGKGATHS